MRPFLLAWGVEFRKLMRQMGFGNRAKAASGLINLAFLAGFGVLVPWRKGFSFLDPEIIVLYTCLAMLFVVPAVSGLLAADDGKPAPDAVLFGRVGSAVLYGWGMAVLALLLGLITVNVSNWHGEVLHPGWGVLSAAVLLGLAASIFVGDLGAFLSISFSPGAARMFFRLVFLLLLLGMVFRAYLLPESWQETLTRQMTTEGLTRWSLIGSAVLLVLSGGMVAALRGSLRAR